MLAVAPFGPKRPARVEDDLGQLMRRVLHRVEEVSSHLEKWDVAEFHEYYRRPRRVLWVSFVSGVARGVGIAVGFTLLGGLLLWILRVLVVTNLPGIGHFVAQLIRIINEDLSLRP